MFEPVLPAFRALIRATGRYWAELEDIRMELWRVETGLWDEALTTSELSRTFKELEEKFEPLGKEVRF